MAQLLVKSKFTAWLKQKGRKKVGSPRLADCCPIATYINETYGHRPVIGKIDYRLIDSVGCRKRKLPTWAKGFIHRVDMHDKFSITGKQALELL
jgi:hypothetical protein